MSLNLKLPHDESAFMEWSDRDDACVTFDGARSEVLIESRTGRRPAIEVLADNAIKLKISANSLLRRIRIHRYSNQPSNFSTRLILEVEGGAKLEIDEEIRQNSTSNNQATHETGIILGEGAQLTWVQSGFFSSTTESSQKHHVQLDKQAQFSMGYFGMGGKKNDFSSRIDLQGSGAIAKVHALQLGRGREKHIQSWESFHRVPEASSEFQIAALAEEISLCEMNGLLKVEVGAEKSSAIMKMKGLFRSTRAQIEGRPQLEILNDNVQVAHGCAMSPIDPEQLFYLRSRGLSVAEAEDLIVRGFISDFLHYRDDEQKDRLLKTIFGGVA